MQNYLELVERIKKGPIVQKEDWDLEYLIKPIRKLCSKYEITWDRNSCIPFDANMIDRIFDAALELAVQAGVYCIDTQRVIHFSKNEIEEGLENAPRSLLIGEGKDARTLFSRVPGDDRPPLIWAGSPGAPMTEDVFLPLVMSWMQEPLVDMITCGSLVSVDGFTVERGAPSEILAVRCELHILHDGLCRVGRPGMGMLAGQSAVSSLGDVSTAVSALLRPCDAHLVAMLNELMIDVDNMNRVANALETKVKNASLATVMVGGLAGDAPGAAILQAASFMLANLVCNADYHILHPIHIRHVATSTRSVMWVQAAVQQAFARNSPCLIVTDVYPKSGAGTRELLYEVAANTIAITVNGGHLEGVGAADGLLPNCSGLEVRWMAEVAHAVVKQKLTVSDAEKLLQKLLKSYEHVFFTPGGNPGKSFLDVYDRSSICPTAAWENIYQMVKEETNRLGLVIS